MRAEKMLQRVCLGVLLGYAAIHLAGCSQETNQSQERVPASTVTTPTVGDAVNLPTGVITLSRVTTSPSTGIDAITGDHSRPGLLIRLAYENSTDATMTIEGFNGSWDPTARASNGSLVPIEFVRCWFKGEARGWDPGQRDIQIGPDGVISAEYGMVQPREQDYPLTIDWRPTGETTATFELR